MNLKDVKTRKWIRIGSILLVFILFWGSSFPVLAEASEKENTEISANGESVDRILSPEPEISEGNDAHSSEVSDSDISEKVEFGDPSETTAGETSFIEDIPKESEEGMILSASTALLMKDRSMLRSAGSYITQEFSYRPFEMLTSTSHETKNEIVSKITLNPARKEMSQIVVKPSISPSIPSSSLWSVNPTKIEVYRDGTDVTTDCVISPDGTVTFDFTSGALSSYKSSKYYIEYYFQTPDPASRSMIDDISVSISTNVQGSSSEGTINETVTDAISSITSRYTLLNDTIIKTAVFKEKTTNDGKIESGELAIADFTWSFENLLSPSGDPVLVTAKGGDYFVFPIYAKDMVILNSYLGDITNTKGHTVGTFFLENVTGKGLKDNGNDVAAFVMFLFDNRVNDTGAASGTFQVISESNRTVENGGNLGTPVNQNISEEVIIGENELNISKSGEWVAFDEAIPSSMLNDRTVMKWTVIVNEEIDPANKSKSMETLQIVDTILPDSTNKFTWEYLLDAGDPMLDVYVEDTSSWKKITKGSDYIVTYDATDDKNKVIIDLQGTYATFAGAVKVEYWGEITGKSFDAQTDIQTPSEYRNQAEAQTSKMHSEKVTASLGKDGGGHLDKDISGSVEQQTWEIRYNFNQAKIPEKYAIIQDTPKVTVPEAGGGTVDLILSIDGEPEVYLWDVDGETRTLLTKGTDYMYTAPNSNGMFQIQLNDTKDLDETDGKISDAYIIVYKTKLPTTHPASGYNQFVFNNSVTTKDGWSGSIRIPMDEGSGILAKSTVALKEGEVDDENVRVNWKVTANELFITQTLTSTNDSFVFYDLLPIGFKLDDTRRVEIVVTNPSTSQSITLDGSKNEFSVELGTAFNDAEREYVDSLRSNTAVDRWFQIAIPLKANVVQANSKIEITYSTILDIPEVFSVDLDATTGSMACTNFVYLETSKIYSASATTYVGRYRKKNMEKGGSSDFAKSQINWTIEMNRHHYDLNGYIFEDVLELGKNMDGSVVADSHQTITEEDITLQILDVVNNSYKTPTDAIKKLYVISVETNAADNDIVKVEFTGSFKYQVRITIRTHVKKNTSDKGSVIAYQYDNKATLSKAGSEPLEVKSSVTFSALMPSMSKLGTTNGKEITYELLLNQNGIKIENPMIVDNLGRPETTFARVLHLQKDGVGTDPKDLKIVVEIVELDSNGHVVNVEETLKYDDDYTIDYTFEPMFDPADKDLAKEELDAKYGFTVSLKRTLEKPLRITYVAEAMNLLSGTKVTNNAVLTGKNIKSETGTMQEVKWTVAVAAKDVNLYDLKLVKKDADDKDKKIDSATFALWDATQSTLLYTKRTDKGVVIFENLTAGIYYLQELDAPDGYKTPIGTCDTAVQVDISRTALSIKWPMSDPYEPELNPNDPISKGTGILPSGGETFEYTVDIFNKKTETGSFEILKKDGTNSIPIPVVSFILSRIIGTERHYYFLDKGADPVNPSDDQVSWVLDKNQSTILISDTDGKIFIDNLEPGNYELEEIGAPKEYVLPTGSKAVTPIEIKVGSSETLHIKKDILNFPVGELKVIKEWADKNNPETAVEVELYTESALGVLTLVTNRVDAKVILNEGNNWTYTWKDLQLYDDNGEPIQYQVEEVAIDLADDGLPDTFIKITLPQVPYHVSTVFDFMKNAFVITNVSTNEVIENTLTPTPTPMVTPTPAVDPPVWIPAFAEPLETVEVTLTNTFPGDPDTATYQWYINGVPIPGATEDSFTVPITVREGDVITVEVTSENGTQSAEATVRTTHPITAFVIRLYAGAFQREPDPGGFVYWINGLLDESITAAGATHFFFRSPEMEHLALSDGEYIERLYTVLLGREYDKAGKAFWLDCIAKGVSRNGILRLFLGTPEFLEICKAAGIEPGEIPFPEEAGDIDLNVTRFLYDLYRTVFGREIDIGGLNYWAGKYFYEDWSLADIARELFFSEEVLAKNWTEEAFVGMMYRTFLNREAEPKGREHWLKELENGMPRETILNYFASCAEFEDITKGSFPF